MSLVNSFRIGRLLGLIVLLGILIAVFIIQYPPATTKPRWALGRPWHGQQKQHPDQLQEPIRGQDDPFCLAFPDPGSIAIAVKTGATEAVEKIPMQMATTLRCALSVMLFSDLEQEISGFHVHDALESIPAAAMEGNSDFDFYHRLKDALKYGNIADMLRDAHDPRITGDLAAWTLDKYKNLHAFEKLYATHPNKDWYLMLDADTYLVWPNLLTWLQRLPDPQSNAMYLGSPATVGDVSFAHGGSGIIISHAAMYDFAVKNNGTAARWDRPMHEECCGDLVVAKVLKENGVLLKPSWPTINGENPSTLPFGPTHWCQPVVTMHHVRPHTMNHISNFEQKRLQEQGSLHAPMTFADLFDNFVRNILPDSLGDWDNLSSDLILAQVDSLAACRQKCLDEDGCFQFRHRGDECGLGRSIHLGSPRKKDPESQGDSGRSSVWSSGWLVERIETWVRQQKACGEPEFPWTTA